MSNKERVTNFLAVVHVIAGKKKAETIRTRLGGSRVYIGRRSAKVGKRNCLLPYLTEEEIFAIRDNYLDLEKKVQIGITTIPKNYIPGVLKQRTKRELILEMYETGLWTDNEIIKSVDCSTKYFGMVIKDWHLYKSREDV